MTVERTHASHRTLYAMRDDAGLRCVLVFDTGEDGAGPPVWKVLLPGPGGSEELYAAHEFSRPDAAQLSRWLEPIVGPDASTELAAAVEAGPPAAAGWQHRADG
jgi:hypothetical protein